MDYHEAYQIYRAKDKAFVDLLTNGELGPEPMYDHIEDYDIFLARKAEWEEAKAVRAIGVSATKQEYIEARLAMNEASGPIGPEHENVASPVRWYEAARYLAEDIERDKKLLSK